MLRKKKTASSSKMATGCPNILISLATTKTIIAVLLRAQETDLK